MRVIIKKILSTILVMMLTASFVSAKNNINIIADVESDFTIKTQELPDEISFKTKEIKKITDDLSIPEGAILTLEILNSQRELRWHKSGLILCKLKNYQTELSEEPIDVADKDIYLVVRKYEPINGKEATITGIELVFAQGASFFAPGVDIAYYFTKGAIQRKKDPNWFKAGVHNAYENSICWFWLKGKPFELSDDDMVQIKNIKPKKAEKLSAKIDKRNSRFERQASKRLSKRDSKNLKKELKYAKKTVDCSVVESIIEDINIDRSVLAEIKVKTSNKETQEVNVTE